MMLMNGKFLHLNWKIFHDKIQLPRDVWQRIHNANASDSDVFYIYPFFVPNCRSWISRKLIFFSLCLKEIGLKSSCWIFRVSRIAFLFNTRKYKWWLLMLFEILSFLFVMEFAWVRSGSWRFLFCNSSWFEF